MSTHNHYGMRARTVSVFSPSLAVTLTFFPSLSSPRGFCPLFPLPRMPTTLSSPSFRDEASEKIPESAYIHIFLDTPAYITHLIGPKHKSGSPVSCRTHAVHTRRGSAVKRIIINYASPEESVAREGRWKEYSDRERKSFLGECARISDGPFSRSFSPPSGLLDSWTAGQG